MIRQSVLPFKLKRTEEKITARSGLALFAEFFDAMSVGQLVDAYMPGPRSGRGFEAIRYIKPLCMSMYGGGENIEDVREIRSSADSGWRSSPVGTLVAMPSTLA